MLNNLLRFIPLVSGDICVSTRQSASRTFSFFLLLYIPPTPILNVHTPNHHIFYQMFFKKYVIKRSMGGGCIQNFKEN